ncbi:hypothetical protein pb186bvf_013933 [Paramecium bursaria]
MVQILDISCYELSVSIIGKFDWSKQCDSYSCSYLPKLKRRNFQWSYFHPKQKTNLSLFLSPFWDQLRETIIIQIVY